MLLKLRQQSFALYRLFFIVITYAIGIVCLCIWILESVLEKNILTIDAGISHDALLATCFITGIVGIAAGSLMLSFMNERRHVSNDRRQQQSPIDFPDRRTNLDRRSEK